MENCCTGPTEMESQRLQYAMNLKKRQIIISGFMLQVENFQRIFPIIKYKVTNHMPSAELAHGKTSRRQENGM